MLNGSRVHVDDLSAFLGSLAHERGGLFGVLVVPVTFELFVRDGTTTIQAVSFVVLW